MFLDHHGRASGDGDLWLRRLVLVVLVPGYDGRENQPNRFDARRSASIPKLTGCLRWSCFCFFLEASGARKASAATCIGCRATSTRQLEI